MRDATGNTRHRRISCAASSGKQTSSMREALSTLIAARSRAKTPQMFANVEWAAGVHRAAEEALKPWTALSCKPSCFTVDHASACFSSHATGFQLGAAVSAAVPSGSSMKDT